jgi:RNA polymerase sigma factor (sigma-70 family)
MKGEEMTVDQDAQLAAKGDIEAFEEIYRRHHKKVYSLCFRMVRSASEAEDLTQEVFLQLFRKLHTFRGESSFSTWLHRLTVNQVLMHFRKATVKTEKTTEDGTTPIRVVIGTENPRRMSLIDRIALNRHSISCHQVIVWYSSCTIWKDMNIIRSAKCWDVQLEHQNPNCIKHA